MLGKRFGATNNTYRQQIVCRVACILIQKTYDKCSLRLIALHCNDLDCSKIHISLPLCHMAVQPVSRRDGSMRSTIDGLIKSH